MITIIIKFQASVIIQSYFLSLTLQVFVRVTQRQRSGDLIHKVESKTQAIERSNLTRKLVQFSELSLLWSGTVFYHTHWK